MSKKIKAEFQCPNCDNMFKSTLYRSIWGKFQENRDLVMNDLINVIECPSCRYKEKVEFSLFYNDPQVFCGVWWEPYPDPLIDKDAKFWAENLGSDNYMAKALRIKDWQEFKDTINKYYTGELKGSPPELPNLSDPKLKRKKRLIKLPKLSKKLLNSLRQNVVKLIIAIALINSLIFVPVSLIKVRKLRKQISHLKYKIRSIEREYSWNTDDLMGRIDDMEYMIYDHEDRIDDMKRRIRNVEIDSYYSY